MSIYSLYLYFSVGLCHQKSVPPGVLSQILLIFRFRVAVFFITPGVRLLSVTTFRFRVRVVRSFVATIIAKYARFLIASEQNCCLIACFSFKKFRDLFEILLIFGEYNIIKGYTYDISDTKILSIPKEISYFIYCT